MSDGQPQLMLAQNVSRTYRSCDFARKEYGTVAYTNIILFSVSFQYFWQYSLRVKWRVFLWHTESSPNPQLCPCSSVCVNLCWKSLVIWHDFILFCFACCFQKFNSIHAKYKMQIKLLFLLLSRRNIYLNNGISVCIFLKICCIFSVRIE